MLAFVYGGAASGKSEYAEQLARNLAGDRLSLFYVATLAPSDPECIDKINRHRTMRQGKGFVTIECPSALSGLCLPGKGVVLLECLSTLVANELFSGRVAQQDVSFPVFAGIQHLQRQSESVVVVSNSLFCDGREYDPDTGKYLQILGGLHQELARCAQLVVEVVAGLPVTRKKNVGEALV